MAMDIFKKRKPGTPNPNYKATLGKLDATAVFKNKKKGGAVKKYATGGITKNKTLSPAGAGLYKKGGAMKKGGSTKMKKK